MSSLQKKLLHALGLLLLCIPLLGQAQQRLSSNDVSIDVIDDRGQPAEQFPVQRSRDLYRAYTEAFSGANYAIRVRNNSRYRIGVVIAVDGRNIISGERSELRPHERMYVLDPYEENVYRGWRTGRDQVNRFYFTDEGASYAAAWDDYSALGVIAVAAFRELRSFDIINKEKLRKSAPSSESAPGTGFGEEEHSPSRRVDFTPEHDPFARYLIKYEWQQTLCEKGVIDCASPEQLTLNDVGLQIVDRQGRGFQQYPVKSHSRAYRAYIEAEPNLQYGLKVTNRSDQRIGIVLAVDGRNIISGKKSKLGAGERMYILDPQQSATYQGWRTGQNKVNQFYFTDAGDSYSAAWKDYSAMGVIAMAVYQEKIFYRQRHSSEISSSKSRSRANEAGTGFGEERYSPSRRVEFTAMDKPFGRYFVKYEWRDVLCEKKVIKCQPRNRLWDEENRNRDDFVQPPPRQSQRGWPADYASSAVAHYRESEELGCGFSGSRWSDNYEAHYRWANGVAKQKANAETKFRLGALAKCRRQLEQSRREQRENEEWAQKYAETAVAQQRENLSLRCGFRGNRWHADYDSHYRYALRVNKGTARAEAQQRESALLNCRLQ